MAIGSHQSAKAKTTTWLTPPKILRELGPFDLDPCCPPVMPWKTAAKMISLPEDGLQTAWNGRVWLNPPYGREIDVWLEKIAAHGNGIALTFARTETEMWHTSIWPVAHAVLFLRGRLHFHREDGTRAKANAGAPSALIAYGEDNAIALRLADLDGQFIVLKV